MQSLILGVKKTIAAQSIMIVDDNIGLTKTMSLILKKQGFTVVVAHDGQEAIAQVESGLKVDIIFMDIKMPKLNGVETFKRLKKILLTFNVIMMTAYAVDDLIQEALLEGAYSIIYKPFEFDYLLTLIEKIRSENNRESILIIDDDMEFCKSLEKSLSRIGFKLHFVDTGKDIIGRVQVEEYDIILIEINLSNEEEHQTFKSLREQHPSIPIIILGSDNNAFQESIEALLLEGGYAYLSKPIDMKQLLSLVQSLAE